MPDYSRDDEWMRNAAEAARNRGYQQIVCPICGAQVISTPVANYGRTHEVFHENYVSREEARAMSSVRWCDGTEEGHPFRAGIPGAQSGVVTEVDDDGNSVTKEIDVCPAHTAKGVRKAAKEMEAIQAEKDWKAQE